MKNKLHVNDEKKEKELLQIICKYMKDLYDLSKKREREKNNVK